MKKLPLYLMFKKINSTQWNLKIYITVKIKLIINIDIEDYSLLHKIYVALKQQPEVIGVDLIS